MRKKYSSSRSENRLGAGIGQRGTSMLSKLALHAGSRESKLKAAQSGSMRWLYPLTVVRQKQEDPPEQNPTKKERSQNADDPHCAFGAYPIGVAGLDAPEAYPPAKCQNWNGDSKTVEARKAQHSEERNNLG